MRFNLFGYIIDIQMVGRRVPKYVLAQRRKLAKKKRLLKKRVIKPKHHTFSEMFIASPLIVGYQQGSSGTLSTPGQVWSAGITSVPQWGAYKNLYRQYRILKIDWLVIPKYTGVTDPNASEVLYGANLPYYEANRMLMIRNSTNTFDSLNATNPYNIPTNEIGFLQDNSCRIYNLNRKPIRFSDKYPKPQFEVAVSNGGVAPSWHPQKNTWMSFDDVTPPNHGSLMTLVVNDGTGLLQAPGAQVAEVYGRIHFQVKDAR